jgi:hypothetical protein
MDVRLPDGTIVRNVPDGMSKADLTAKLASNGYDIGKLSAPPSTDLSSQIHAADSANAGLPGFDNAGSSIVATQPAADNSSLLDKVTGGIEAGRALVTSGILGGLGQAGGTIGGLASSIASGTYGTAEGARNVEQHAADATAALSKYAYQPKTAKGAEYTQRAGDAMESSGIVGIPIPELEALSRAASSSRAAIGGLARANAAAADAADAAARAGHPPLLPPPADIPAAAPVNYDVPAYLRRGTDPTALPVPPADALPALPPATPAAPQTALEAYASQPAAAPYGALNEPVPLPASAPQTALDQFAAAQQGAAPAVHPLANEMRLPETAIAPAPVAAPTPPADALIAQMADTSDIQAVLDQYGIKLPGKEAPVSGAAPSAAAGGAGEPPLPPPPEMAFDHTGPLDPTQRQQVLGNVGVTRMRKSAIDANEAAAATDYQLSKYTSEPAGMAALDQFAHERDALAAHVQGMIDRTGAVSGLDESALQAKGQDIAAPYDAAREYFENAKNSLYDIANQRAAASKAPVATGPLDALLADPDFKATLMAKDQHGLLHTIESQYQRFKALGPDGQMTMTNAERFRKWLNAVWSPDKSHALGQVKVALDEGVFKAAGTDVYQAARGLHMLEKRVFEDPHGISHLFDSDPYTPINRATPYNKIPDAIINLSPDQFAHIVDTYKNLPPALQPAAQKALATLRAHYADKFLNAGTATNYGNARQLWNRGGINNLVRNNSAKLPLVFDAHELAQLRDLVDAGNILAVNASYPGASAQAAQALKRGMMSRVAGKATAAIGGGAGALFGPAGAGAGALLGDAVGSKIIDHIGERKALAEFKKSIIDTARATKKSSLN